MSKFQRDKDEGRVSGVQIHTYYLTLAMLIMGAVLCRHLTVVQEPNLS